MGDIIKNIPVLAAIHKYFEIMRVDKDMNLDIPLIDNDLLLIVRFIIASGENPVKLLHHIGIILFNDKIAVNCNILKDILFLSTSRINDEFGTLKWNIIPIENNDKLSLLEPLIDNSNAENWTLRKIPQSSKLHKCIKDNPQVLFSNSPNAKRSIIIPLLIILLFLLSVINPYFFPFFLFLLIYYIKF